MWCPFPRNFPRAWTWQKCVQCWRCSVCMAEPRGGFPLWGNSMDSQWFKGQFTGNHRFFPWHINIWGFSGVRFFPFIAIHKESQNPIVFSHHPEYFLVYEIGSPILCDDGWPPNSLSLGLPLVEVTGCCYMIDDLAYWSYHVYPYCHWVYHMIDDFDVGSPGTCTCTTCTCFALRVAKWVPSCGQLDRCVHDMEAGKAFVGQDSRFTQILYIYNNAELQHTHTHTHICIYYIYIYILYIYLYIHIYIYI